jgi:hypothetical protein
MVARSVAASSVPSSVPFANHAPASGGKSCEKFDGKFARPFDMHGCRRSFPDRWSAFLRAHFASPVQVALFFDMQDTTTARHWWNGSNAPMAHFVMHAIDKIPEAINFLRAA